MANYEYERGKLRGEEISPLSGCVLDVTIRVIISYSKRVRRRRKSRNAKLFVYFDRIASSLLYSVFSIGKSVTK